MASRGLKRNHSHLESAFMPRNTPAITGGDRLRHSPSLAQVRRLLNRYRADVVAAPTRRPAAPTVQSGPPARRAG